MTHGKEVMEFCTIREAAQWSGLALKTWYEGGAGTGKVPRVRFGRAVRLLRKDVEKFISERIYEAEQAVGRSETSHSCTASGPPLEPSDAA